MEENEEQSAVNELDEAEENDEEFSGNELDENDEESSGNELDEPEDETSESIPDQEPIKGAEKIYKGKGRLWMFIAIGLFLLSGIGYLSIKGEMSPVTSTQKEGFAIPKDQLLVFRSFVIPFNQSLKYSYISLSIAFKLPNKELRGEMVREKYRLRGIIYDMLTEEVNGLKEVPRIEKLKKCIISAVNGAVSMGKINDAYITDLLAV
ncbi:MAG: hypothetical protein JRD02_04205 [Deltaproteobacteria bacterium]|nr:hypothetical protein [Deltaproteobacteria bacterium]